LTQSLEELSRTAGDLLKGIDWNDLIDAVAKGDARLQELIDKIVEGTSTVHVDPGESIADAVERLPGEGGELSLAAGTHVLDAPLVIAKRARVVISGAGPATIVRASAHESALVLEDCQEILVSRLRIESGTPAADAKEAKRHINGALTVLGGTDITVSDCTLACPDGELRGQSCLTVRPSTTSRANRVRVDRCRLEVGAWGTGVLVVDPPNVTIERNHAFKRPGASARDSVGRGIVVAGAEVGTVRILDNVVEDTIMGITVGVSRGGVAPAPAADIVALSGNVVRALVPTDYKRDRYAVFVGNALSVSIVETTATLSRSPALIPSETPTPIALPATPPPGPRPVAPASAALVTSARVRVTPVEGLRLFGTLGPFILVRGTSLRDFHVGVRVVPLQAPSVATWTVTDTLASGAAQGVDAPATVTQERNQPAPRILGPGTPARVVLTPAVATSATGTETTFRATAFDSAGLRVPGVTMRFSVAGANSRAETGVTSDANGEAPFAYTGTVPGTDTITAYADLDRNGKQSVGEPFAIATQSYLPAAVSSLKLSETFYKVTIGKAVALPVLATNAAGQPVADVTIAVEILGPNAQPAPVVKTDAKGQAVVTYTGSKAGTDTVNVRVQSGAVVVANDTAAVTYLAPAPTSVVLAPVRSFAFLQDEVSLVATVTDAAGSPVASTAVRFTITPEPVVLTAKSALLSAIRVDQKISRSVTTDAKGQATLTYKAGEAGTRGEDQIVAFVSLTGSAEQAVSDPFATAFVALKLRTQEQRVLVPDLTGLTQAGAAKRLADGNLVLGTVTTLGKTLAFAARLTAAFVESQSPQAGLAVVPGSAVDIVLRRGVSGETPPIIVVPPAEEL
jgi:hypothetical protein